MNKKVGWSKRISQRMNDLGRCIEHDVVAGHAHRQADSRVMKSGVAMYSSFSVKGTRLEVSSRENHASSFSHNDADCDHWHISKAGHLAPRRSASATGDVAAGARWTGRRPP